ncbi:hypothetical protein HHI36_005418 [Cryptolaemus montrouzieri]|uniref:Uncharacterized protein n=1 Tax=Cryptolaemus montrouzieri TaxID=559131 RepID=A0ABD2NUC9_9CUCU
MTKLDDICLVISDIKITQEYLKAEIASSRSILGKHSRIIDEHTSTLVIHYDILKLQQEEISTLQSNIEIIQKDRAKCISDQQQADIRKSRIAQNVAELNLASSS